MRFLRLKGRGPCGYGTAVKDTIHHHPVSQSESSDWACVKESEIHCSPWEGLQSDLGKVWAQGQVRDYEQFHPSHSWNSSMYWQILFKHLPVFHQPVLCYPLTWNFSIALLVSLLSEYCLRSNDIHTPLPPTQVSLFPIPTQWFNGLHGAWIFHYLHRAYYCRVWANELSFMIINLSWLLLIWTNVFFF